MDEQFANERPYSFLKAQFGLPLGWNRKDICRHWGLPEGSSIREVFESRGLRYTPFKQGGFREARRVFTHEINGATREISSFRKFCEEVLLMNGPNMRIAAEFFRKKYLIKYDNTIFTASLHEEEQNPGFYRGFDENPYNKLKILQTMREIGLYTGEISTMSEICACFFIDPNCKNKKEQICEILDIPYVASQVSNSRPREPCSFRDLTTGEVLNFGSMVRASRFFNMNDQIVKRYFLSGERFHSGGNVYQS